MRKWLLLKLANENSLKTLDPLVFKLDLNKILTAVHPLIILFLREYQPSTVSLPL